MSYYSPLKGKNGQSVGNPEYFQDLNIRYSLSKIAKVRTEHNYYTMLGGSTSKVKALERGPFGKVFGKP